MLTLDPSGILDKQNFLRQTFVNLLSCWYWSFLTFYIMLHLQLLQEQMTRFIVRQGIAPHTVQLKSQHLNHYSTELASVLVSCYALASSESEVMFY